MGGRDLVAVPALRPRIGRYRLLGPVGQGGMADVFLALADAPTGVHKLAVVKVLRSSHRHDDDLITMFMDEARIAARLTHPNVVQTHEVDVDAGMPYIAMEFLDGQPLHAVQRVLPDGVPRDVTLRVLVELLAGLHYAHELEDYDGTPLCIVHRDVSPQNVFVTYDGFVKLMDFGIAKAMDSVAETGVGVLKGKLAYMAPEQVHSDNVDRRADLFAVGVLLWEGIAGRRMWRDVPELEIAKRLDAGRVPTLPDDVEVSAPLRAVCERATAVDPAARWPTADAFRRALANTPEGETMATPERIGARLRDAFAEDRRQLTQMIEESMRALGLSSPALASGESANRRPSDETRRVTRPLPNRDADVAARLRGLSPEPASAPVAMGADEPTRVDGRSDLVTAVATTTVSTEPAPGRARRWRSLALVGAIAGAAGVIGTWWWEHGPVAPREGATTTAEVTPNPAPNPSASGTCAGSSDDAPLTELSGDIDADATLHCDTRYLLRFNTFVRPGATLTIEPGTVIVGDLQTRATLVVQPGARIVAEGTPERPIVFTSERPASQRAAGDWGGLILLGRAPINLVDRQGHPIEGRVEGLTEGGAYGGDDPEDDSGRLRWVRIEYGGIAIAPNNEINGLTLAGVGRGTTIDHVQVRRTADDCFEFFGGTVDADHLLCDDPGDDGIDWDYGYAGRLHHVVVRSPSGEHGIEGDNEPNGTTQAPVSSPTLSQVTLCGGASPDHERYGMLLRRSTRARIHGLVTSGWDAAVDVRDARTEIEITGARFGEARVHPIAIEEREAVRAGPEADDDHGLDERTAWSAAAADNATGTYLADCLRDAAALRPSAPLILHAEPPEGLVGLREAPAGAFADADDRWDEPWAVW